jgi:hypothetical protein
MESKKLHWAGIILSSLLGSFFAFNVLVKLLPETFYPQIVEQMAGIGLPASILRPIAILEGICLLTYLIPATSILGAILFTGYLGGAILTHLRVDQPVYMQATLGILIWLGVYLREPRLWNLLPLRKQIK